MRKHLKATVGMMVLLPLPKEKTTEAGLYLPDTVKNDEFIAEIVDLNPGEENDPDFFQVGDRVVYAKHTVQPCSIDGTNYLLVQFSNILAKVVKEGA